MNTNYGFEPRAATHAGARLLDERKPGWYKGIRPEDIMSVNSATGCPLKVLYGDYNAGANHLFPVRDPCRSDRIFQHGFCCCVEADAAIVVAWRGEIALRQGIDAIERAASDHVEDAVAYATVPS